MNDVVFHLAPSSSVADLNATIDTDHALISEVILETSSQTIVEIENGAEVRLDSNENISYAIDASSVDEIKSHYESLREFAHSTLKSETTMYNIYLLVDSPNKYGESITPTKIRTVANDISATNPHYEWVGQDTFRISLSENKKVAEV